jgi:hypothetical protein
MRHLPMIADLKDAPTLANNECRREFNMLSLVRDDRLLHEQRETDHISESGITAQQTMVQIRNYPENAIRGVTMLHRLRLLMDMAILPNQPCLLQVTSISPPRTPAILLCFKILQSNSISFRHHLCVLCL